MAKTSPTGVRFEEELLQYLRSGDETITAQKALSMYEESFMREFSLFNKKSVKPILIYKLINPITDNVFYVGRTTFLLHQRLGMHLGQRNSKSQGINQVKISIINEIMKEGQMPKIELIETVIPTDESEYRGHHDREVYWIAKLLFEGHQLTNKIPDRAKQLLTQVAENNKPENKKKIEENIDQPKETLTFLQILQMAKEGANRAEVEDAIAKKRTLTLGQQDIIRRKITN